FKLCYITSILKPWERKASRMLLRIRSGSESVTGPFWCGGSHFLDCIFVDSHPGAAGQHFGIYKHLTARFTIAKGWPLSQTINASHFVSILSSSLKELVQCDLSLFVLFRFV